MAQMVGLLQDGTLVLGASALLYGGTVAASALVALFARSEDRRRSARSVLRLLLRRSRP